MSRLSDKVRIALAAVLPFLILSLALLVTQSENDVVTPMEERIAEGGYWIGIVAGYLALLPVFWRRSIVLSVLVGALYVPIVLAALTYFALWWAGYFFGRTL